MIVHNIAIDEIKIYENNPRKNDQAVEGVKKSIKEFGFKVPMIITSDKVIIAGHTRLKAAQQLGYKEVPCVIADDLTEDQIRAFRIADNKTAETAEWDFELLKAELEGLEDMFTGFDEEELKEMFGEDEEDIVERYQLADLFLMSPFSILDGKMGEWQDRKKQWIELGIKSEIGRKENLMGSPEVNEYVNGTCTHFAPSTSIFDPVICELMYKWFNIENGEILDPFAGGGVRGIVASKLGYKYTGIDLREEQILANIENAKEILEDIDIPNWIVGDSVDIKEHTKGHKYDMIFSCPPYHDLEVYSNDTKDISNMNYEDFIKAYNTIIKESLDLLKDNRFAVFVVGDIRDKNGFYKDFISDTKKAFINNDCFLYNEIIKIDPYGTAGLRAKKTFSNRKVIKVHQNILVFYKGKPNEIKNNYNHIEWLENIGEENYD